MDNGGIKMKCLKYSNMLLQMFMFSFRSFPGDILGLKSISEELFCKLDMVRTKKYFYTASYTYRKLSLRLRFLFNLTVDLRGRNIGGLGPGGLGNPSPLLHTPSLTHTQLQLFFFFFYISNSTVTVSDQQMD